MGRIVNNGEMIVSSALYTATMQDNGFSPFKISTQTVTQRLNDSGMFNDIRAQYIGGVGGLFSGMILVSFRTVLDGYSAGEMGQVLAGFMNGDDYLTDFQFIQMQTDVPANVPVFGNENTPAGGQPPLAPTLNDTLQKYAKWIVVIGGVILFMEIGGVGFVRDALKGARDVVAKK